MTTVYLTIDFEDFAHDLRRDLGLWESGQIREDALWKAFDNIEKYKDVLGIKGITYFCTAILAEKCPNLIKYISEKGNEVACHYYYHDSLVKHGYKKVKYNLEKAKNLLENTTNQEVLGFRAPRFSVNADDIEMFNLISTFFKYDSSLPSILFQKNKTKLLNTGLQFFPINSIKLLNRNVQLGGTFLKFFPKYIFEKIIETSIKNDDVLQVYLHPYEFLREGQFLLNWNDLEGLTKLKQFYWFYRQHQWHTFGNKRILQTVDYIFRDFRFGERLSNNLIHD